MPISILVLPGPQPKPSSDPLSPSSSCEEASSHCSTTRRPSSAITRGYLWRSTGTGGQDPVLFTPHPRTSPSTCTDGSTNMYVCAHTPWFSPMLQEFQQEVIASVRHDVLRNPRGRRMDTGGWGGRVWIPGFLVGTVWSGRQLPSCLWDPGGQKFPGTHVVVMISSLVLRISSTGPWYLQRTAQWEGRPQSGDR